MVCCGSTYLGGTKIKVTQCGTSTTSGTSTTCGTSKHVTSSCRPAPGTVPKRPGCHGGKVTKSGRPAPGSVPKPGTPGGPRFAKAAGCRRPDGIFGGRINGHCTPKEPWNAGNFKKYGPRPGSLG